MLSCPLDGDWYREMISNVHYTPLVIMLYKTLIGNFISPPRPLSLQTSLWTRA